MSLPKALVERTMSGFPLSIGTGLALEAIFQPVEESLHETPPTPLPDRTIYSSYVFNVATIVRNLISVIPYHELITIPTKHLVSVSIDEVSYLESFFTSNDTTPYFYINDYSYFKKTYKDTIRKASTDKQIFIEMLTNRILKEISNSLNYVKKFTKDIYIGREEKSLLLSHVPADLLSHTRFTNLDLLESHTGVIKSRIHWNTKYFPVPNRDMTFLPFYEYLLTVFGDRHMFRPKPIKDRVEVYEHMVKLGVNPMSSEFSMLLKIK